MGLFAFVAHLRVETVARLPEWGKVSGELGVIKGQPLESFTELERFSSEGTRWCENTENKVLWSCLCW